MAKRNEVQMPHDWNDHQGWNDYHRSQAVRKQRDAWDDETGSIRLEYLPKFASDMKTQGWRSVWVPGCGLSPMACLLAHLGLEVVATDISPAAVQFQRDATSKFGHLTAKLDPPDPSGSLAVEVHDFRTDFRREEFDLIINVKAFQAFPSTDLTEIARVHAAALRPGRYAYFDTMNVQGERRDQLEQALEAGGFFVPLLSLNRWYRNALRESGIPHVFILGQPMIPRTGEYADGGPKWDADTARLRTIVTEYKNRLTAEEEAERSRIDVNAKVANVIYSTG